MKKKRKKHSFLKKILIAILLLCSLLSTICVSKELIQMYKGKKELNSQVKINSKLKDKKDGLELRILDLKNTEYLLRYARGKYLVTKEDGEQVFKLPD